MLKHMTKIETDNRRCDIILPKRIVYASEGVTRADWVLTNTDTQTQPMTKNYTTLSTRNGMKAAILLDFGTELFGGVQIITQGLSVVAGIPAKIRFGESANEALAPVGVKGACCDHGIRDYDIILPPNGCTRIGQTGFRFVYIELTQPETFVRFYALQGVCIYRDIPYIGSFRCNDEILNNIYDTCAYTVHLCMQNLLWDGIKRDRVVFIGDMHPEILAIRTVFGNQPIVDDSLRYVAEHSPLPDWPNGITSYGMWYLLSLRDWYWYSGNKAFVAELSYYWKPLLLQLLPLVHEEGEEILIEDELARGYFLDWPSKDHPEAKGGIYGLLELALCAAVELCNVIEDTDLAEHCADKARVLANASFEPGEKKQVTAMLQLAGMAQQEKAAESLTKGAGHGMSTFQSYYILKAVTQTADVSKALAMLREYYGAMLDVGATTFWEDFDLDWVQEGASIEKLWQDGEYDIHGDNGRHCYVGFRHSLCHGWSAGPTAFLAEDILGIRIVSPGCKKVSIKPNLGDLEWVKGTYPTPYGTITVEAKRIGNAVETKIDVPDGIEVV